MATTTITSHKVADVAKWKEGFAAGEAARNQAGITIEGVYQSEQDENTIVIISRLASLETAMSLFESPEIKAAMEKSGVISKPEITILKQI